jgi:hypothetical protein
MDRSAYKVTSPYGEGVLVRWRVSWPRDDPGATWEIRAQVEEDPYSGQPIVVRLEVDPLEYPLTTGGLPMRLLRTLTFTGALKAARPYLPRPGATESRVSVPIDVVREVAHRERGKRLRGQDGRTALAFLAWAYEAAARAGPKPNVAVAEALGDGWTAGKVHNQVVQAMKKGLFEKQRSPEGPRSRAPGGMLTPAGESLVSERLLSLLPTESGFLVTQVGDGAAGVASLQEFAMRFSEEADGSPPPEGIIADATGAKPHVFTKERSPGVRVMRG